MSIETGDTGLRTRILTAAAVRAFEGRRREGGEGTPTAGKPWSIITCYARTVPPTLMVATYGPCRWAAAVVVISNSSSSDIVVVNRDHCPKVETLRRILEGGDISVMPITHYRRVREIVLRNFHYRPSRREGSSTLRLYNARSLIVCTKMPCPSVMATPPPCLSVRHTFLQSKRARRIRTAGLASILRCNARIALPNS